MQFYLHRRFLTIAVLAASSVLLSGCLKDKYNPKNFMKPNWEPGIGVPIATFNISLANFLKNDSTLTIDSVDKSVRVVFRNDTLAEQSVGDVLEIPSQDPTSTTLKLGVVGIDGFGSSQTVLLSSLLNNLDPVTGNAINQGIALGIPTPFPPIPTQAGGTYNLPTVTDFSQVTFSEGALNFTLNNGYPTTLDSVVMELRNSGSPNPIGVARFGNVLPNTQQIKSISLVGQTLSNNMVFSITKISSAGTGTNNVLIQGSQALSFSIAGDSLKVVNGIVILPSQDFSADTTRVDFATGGNEELYGIDLNSGNINFSFNSSISEPIQVRISLPSISVGGAPINRIINIAPNSTTNENILLAGGTIDLTTDAQQPYNIIPVIVQASLVSSGTLQPIDSSNSLTVTYGFGNIGFDMVRGYFGQKNIQIEESTIDLNLSFLKELGGSIFLANPKIDLNVVNSIGAPIRLTLNMVGSTVSGQSESLNSPPQMMPFPTVAGTSASGVLSYNRNNSRLPFLLSLPPDTLTTSGLIVLNPNGNQGPNFLGNNSRIKIGMEADLPFELSASDIGFGDTSEFDGSSLNGIVSAKLRFRSVNEFPFDMVMDVVFLDSVDAELHRVSGNLVLSGQVDANGRVVAPSNGLSELELTSAAMPAVRRAKKMIIKLRMSTSELAGGGRQVVKIYTDYSMRLTVGIQATARVSDFLGGGN